MVLGDVPLVFYLLAGYVAMLAAWRNPWIFLPLTMLFWGIAIITKAQTLPFWMAALILPIVVALFKHSWRTVIFLSIALIGSWMVSQGLIALQASLLREISLSRPPLEGLYQVIAIVPSEYARRSALVVILYSGLPTLTALAYFSWRYIKNFPSLNMGDGHQVVLLSMLVFSGSWFIWFVLLSSGGPRYLATPGFVASIFVSALFCDFTGGFRIKNTILRAAHFLQLKDRSAAALRAVFTVILVGPMVIITCMWSYPAYFSTDDSLAQVTTYLNAYTPSGSLVETYESEIYPFLERPYHYPPDQVYIQLMYRYLQDPHHPIMYDPLAAGPDYLVVGGTAAAWRLYDEAVAGDEFKLVKEFPRYLVYQRQR